MKAIINNTAKIPANITAFLSGLTSLFAGTETTSYSSDRFGPDFFFDSLSLD